MLFNSLTFIYLFLPVTVLGFWALYRWGGGGLTAASLWLVILSLVFYGYWKVSYLPLLLGSVTFNYICGALIQSSQNRKRLWLCLGVAGNLLLLGWFKYAGFVFRTCAALGWPIVDQFELALPLAISFFTFTQIAFLVDVYHARVSLNPLRYTLFVTFFPHLIAGPIIHYHAIGAQMADRKKFRVTADNLCMGGCIFIVGLFKKVLIADHFATFANPVFAAAQHGSTIWFVSAWTGALSYALQIYFDFSGYSDMAVGLARMFGIDFPANFHSPYQATSLIDFWRRWHITLSKFLRDFLYIPLGGNRRGPIRRYLNLLVTMGLGGLWHGANWTFLFWGLFHGVGLMVNHAWSACVPRDVAWRSSPVWRLVSWGMTMGFVVVGWVSFRANSFPEARQIYSGMFAPRSLAAISIEDLISWPVLLLGLVWVAAALLPNSNDYFRIEVGRDIPARVMPEVLRFRTHPLHVIALCLLFFTVLKAVLTHEPSEFLYFDF